MFTVEASLHTRRNAAQTQELRMAGVLARRDLDMLSARLPTGKPVLVETHLTTGEAVKALGELVIQARDGRNLREVLATYQNLGVDYDPSTPLATTQSDRISQACIPLRDAIEARFNGLFE